MSSVVQSSKHYCNSLLGVNFVKMLRNLKILRLSVLRHVLSLPKSRASITVPILPSRSDAMAQPCTTSFESKTCIFLTSLRSASHNNINRNKKRRVCCDAHKRARILSEMEGAGENLWKCTPDSPCDESHPIFIEKVKCVEHGNMRMPESLEEVEGRMVCKGETRCRVKKIEESIAHADKNIEKSAVTDEVQKKKRKKRKEKSIAQVPQSEENAKTANEKDEASDAVLDENPRVNKRKTKKKKSPFGSRRVCAEHLKWRSRERLTKNADSNTWKCAHGSECSKIPMLEDAKLPPEPRAYTPQGAQHELRRCRLHDRQRYLQHLEQLEDGTFRCKDQPCQRRGAREVCSIHKVLRSMRYLNIVERRRKLYVCNEKFSCYKAMPRLK